MFTDEYGVSYFGMILIGVGAIILVFVVAVLLGVVVTYYSCVDFIEINQAYEVQWNFWNGCMVKNNAGFWINKNQIDFIQGELWQLTPK